MYVKTNPDINKFFNMLFLTQNIKNSNKIGLKKLCTKN